MKINKKEFLKYINQNTAKKKGLFEDISYEYDNENLSIEKSFNEKRFNPKIS